MRAECKRSTSAVEGSANSSWFFCLKSGNVQRVSRQLSIIHIYPAWSSMFAFVLKRGLREGRRFHGCPQHLVKALTEEFEQFVGRSEP